MLVIFDVTPSANKPEPGVNRNPDTGDNSSLLMHITSCTPAGVLGRRFSQSNPTQRPSMRAPAASSLLADLYNHKLISCQPDSQ